MDASRLLWLLLWFVVTMDTGDCAQVEGQFEKVDAGLTVGGIILQTYRARLNLECATMCSRDTGCLYYQFGTQQGKVCLIIGLNTTQDEVLTVKEGYHVYKKVNENICLGPKTWPTSDEPVFYHGFEIEEGFTNYGADPVPGIVGDYAAQLVKGESDYIDFGTTAQAACIVMGDCPNGGTISVWLKTPSSNTGGLLTSVEVDYRGFYYEYNNGLRHVYVTGGGYYEVTVSIPSGWFHSIMVFTAGPGVTAYINAASVGSDSTPDSTWTYSAASGQFVVGRQYIDNNNHYNDLFIDELAFWNRPLTTQEIQDLYAAYTA